MAVVASHGLALGSAVAASVTDLAGFERADMQRVLHTSDRTGLTFADDPTTFAEEGLS